MRNAKLKTILAAVATIAVAGCSSSKDATEQNFATAISDKLAAEPPLCTTMFMWPETVDSRDDVDGPQLRALEKIGFVSSRSAPTSDPLGRPVPAREYQLTELGKQHSDGRRFCFGTPTLDKVIAWEPVKDVSDVGAKDTIVTFTYKVDKLEDWAKRADIQTAFPTIKSTIDRAGRQPIKLAMTLRGDRWTVDWSGSVIP